MGLLIWVSTLAPTPTRPESPLSACVPDSLLVSRELINTQGNPISGYRRLRDFGGKQMMSSSDSVCTYPLLMIKKVLLEDKQRNLYFLS